MSDPTLPTSGLPTQPTTHESAAPDAPPGPMPQRIGRYTILRTVGEGGMGTVYEARQDAPDRVVALKVIRAGYLSPKLLRRFEHESQILGRLHHPGIAQVYEAGTVEDEHGRTVPFFAMEFVRGVDLTTHARTRELSTRQRLDLMARICDAVDHAHAKGVIHRDLKPSNILIDESGHPKILDFGVARATDSDIAQTTMHTDIGQLIGTVPYMSPEQVAGDPESLDTRSDVYALGVIAYELLAGRLPYDLERRMIHEAVRVIREVEPSRLSLADRTLRGDIETIVAKALEKEPARRYPSADALASDIRRYLRDEPITARPASTWYQVSKFARRNRALVAGVIAAFLILLAGIAATSWQAFAATQARDQAQANLARAEQAEADAQARADELQQVADFQSQMLAQIDTTAAGVELMEDVRARFEAALEKAGVSDAERDSQSDTLRSLLTRVNATDTAAAMIDRTILQPAVEAIGHQFADQPIVDAQLRQTLADRYRSIGLYDAASPLQESALATRRRVLGEEHPDTLLSITSTGVLLRAQGKLAEAEPYVREAMEKSRRVLGEEHPDTLGTIQNMGFQLKQQGKLAEAEPYMREALEKYRRVLGEEHPNTLLSINNMGPLLQAQGKLAEAEPYMREALEKYRRVLGEEHPDTLNAVNNMGALLQARGKFAESEPYYREAMEKRRRVLGEEHPITLSSIDNMGFQLKLQGRLAESEPYYREALEKRRRVLGDEHPHTLQSIHSMGSLLRSQGKLAEAEAYHREALEKRRRVLGAEHPETLRSINSMGVVLQEQGKLAEAEPYYRECLEKCRRVLGEDHPNTLASIEVMGLYLKAQGRLTEAEPFFREALDKSRRVLGEDHPEMLHSMNSMAVLLQSQGKLAEAEPYFRETLEKRRRLLGEQHADTLTSTYLMGSLLREQGKHQETIDLLAPAEPAARKALTGGNAVRLAGFLTALGRARVGLGYERERFMPAESNLLEAHQILIAAASRGPRHKDTIGCAQGLIDLYTAWHAAEPGKGYDAKAAQWQATLDAASAPSSPN